MPVGREPLIMTTLFCLCYFVLCFSVVPVLVGRGPLISTSLFCLCYFVLFFRSAGDGRTGTFDKYFVILSLLFCLVFLRSVGVGLTGTFDNYYVILSLLFCLCYFVLCFSVVPVSVGRGPSSPSTS